MNANGRVGRRALRAIATAAKKTERPSKEYGSAQPSAPALPAKLLRPDPTHAIARPRLLRVLGRRSASPVVWVHAPAGAGKTFLLAAHLQAQKHPTLWYEVDASDRDVSSLFHHVGLAAEDLLGRALGLPVWQPNLPVGLEGFARRFFVRLFGELPPGCCLAFDNYQAAAGASDWNAAFRELVAARPKQIRILVASRQAPPSSLSRFRATGELALLDFEQLRFDEREIRSLMKQRRVQSGESEALMRSTQGWAVAVSLLATGLPARAHAGGVVLHVRRSRRAMESVFDFLAGEILERLDEGSRAFLLQVALMPHFNVEMAAKLTGRVDAPAVLDRLHRDHLLLDRHEDDQYRLHDLFRAFLLERGRLHLPHDARRDAQLVAAQLLAANGHFDTACTLLAEAADWPALITLIEVGAPALAAQGRLATISSALDRLPAIEHEGRPWLLFWRALVLLGRSPDTRGLAERAFHSFRASGDVVGLFLAWAVVVQSIIVEGNDFHELLGWLKAREELPPLPPVPFLATRVASTEIMGLAHAGGSYDASVRLRAERALALVHANGTLDERVIANASAAMLFCFGGESGRAMELLFEARQELLASVSDPFSKLVYMHAELLVVCCIGGDFRAAPALVEEALQLAKAEGIRAFNLGVLILGAGAALAVKDAKTARRYLQTMRMDTRPLSSRLARGQLEFVVAAEALERGDMETCNVALHATIEQAERLGFAFARVQCAIAALILAAETRDVDRSRAAICDVEDRLRSTSSPYLVAHGALAIAYSRLRLGQDCLAELREALRLARTVGYAGSGFINTTMIGELCSAALEHGIEVEYASKLLRMYEVEPSDQALLLSGWPWPARLRLLGTVEIELAGERVALGRKMPVVPLTLLKLLAVSERPLSVAKVVSTLWPHSGAASSRGALDMAVYRLRKLLGSESAIQHTAGALALSRSFAWTDVRAVQHVCLQIETLGRTAQGQGERLTRWQQALNDLWRGPLGTNADPPHLLKAHARLEQRIIGARALLAAYAPAGLDRPQHGNLESVSDR